ncbi:hypothetical protein DSTSK_29960 [Desulforhabdus sp. TSK]|nr:hypothetical protein DSTSK_29960 [Desulforhabdus sp. TSK]
MMTDPKPLNKDRFSPVGGMRLVYDPGMKSCEGMKKHPCRDCHSCQFCSDARCHSCRGKKGTSKDILSRKLSLCEQIQVYEAINAQDRRQQNSTSL